MEDKEKFELIEKTIKDVEGDHTITRLLIDCSDKLSLSVDEVREILIRNNSELLKQ